MEYMSKAKGGQGGCIVAISSTTALNPTEVVCIYGATKSALSYFTRTLAVGKLSCQYGANKSISNTLLHFQKPIYFDKTGIRFITVFPGATKTKMLCVAGERSLAAQYCPEVKNLMSNLETQSTAVFAEKLIDVVETAPNGSTVVIDEGTVQEITIPEVWGPAIK